MPVVLDNGVEALEHPEDAVGVYRADADRLVVDREHLPAVGRQVHSMPPVTEQSALAVPTVVDFVRR